jgi:hypothetical protein
VAGETFKPTANFFNVPAGSHATYYRAAAGWSVSPEADFSAAMAG